MIDLYHTAKVNTGCSAQTDSVNNRNPNRHAKKVSLSASRLALFARPCPQLHTHDQRSGLKSKYIKMVRNPIDREERGKYKRNRQQHHESQLTHVLRRPRSGSSTKLQQLSTITLKTPRQHLAACACRLLSDQNPSASLRCFAVDAVDVDAAGCSGAWAHNHKDRHLHELTWR